MNDIQKITSDSPEAKSLDITQQNIEQLKQIFPDVFTEGKVDFEALKAVLGDAVDDSDERYNFTWSGKAKARQIAQTPSTGTLRPCIEESVNWDETENLFIEGDNLEVLKLLQKSYHKKVKMIYIDPPYNTGRDFVYKDSFKDNIKDYLVFTKQLDNSGRPVGTNLNTSGRFHSNWLNMMYPRLRLARNLLCDDGVIFISLNDKEISNLKQIMNEIFGEENFLGCLVWDKNHSAQAGIFKVYHEYVLVYAKSVELVSTPKSTNNELFEAGAIKRESKRHPLSEFTFPSGVRFDAEEGTELKGTWGGSESVELIDGRMVCEDGKTKYEVTLKAAYTQKNQMQQFFYGEKDSLVDSRGQKITDFYFTSTGKIKIVKERGVETPATTLTKYGTQSSASNELAALFDLNEAPIDNPKPVSMLLDFIKWFTDDNDIILDFFAGSGSTAEAVIRSNIQDDIGRRYIMVQLPEHTPTDSTAYKSGFEKISDLAMKRLKLVSEKYSQENKNLKAGFKVFKLDATNIHPWEADSDNLEDILRQSIESIKLDRSAEDVLYEILLKYGIELTVPVETEIVNGKKVFVVGAGALIVCLDDEITSEVVEGVAKLKDELDPETTQVVFKDAGFADSNVKTNAIQILKQAGIDDVKSI